MPSNNAMRGYWNRYWIGIRKANDPINNIDRIPEGRPEYLERLKAEARFLRAYYKSQLVALYGDIPLVTEVTNVGDFVGRTDKEVVVDFILAELEEVAGILPISYGSSDIGRATRGAALALKARVALRNERWAVARDAAEDVMDLGVYELFPDYEELFRYAGMNSAEVIFDRQYATGFSTANHIGRSASSIGGTSPIDPINHLAIQHERIEPEDPDTYPMSWMYEGLDPRFGYNVLYTGAVSVDGSIYNSWPDSPTGDRIGRDEYTNQYGFNVRKWVDYEADIANPGGSTINFIILRYADVLLMYAEAKIELNELDQSVYDAINEVRQRPTVEMPPITTGKTQAELREIVRRERTVEFPFEGIRMFDMNRWRLGEEKAGLVQGMWFIDPDTGEWELFDRGLTRLHRADRDYLWPIPDTEVNTKENMTQNPNY